MATKKLMLTIVAIAALAMPFASRAQTTKFHGANFMKLPKACGNGLDQDSACGDCIRAGVALTKYASCGHVCVKLPDRLAPSSVILVPSGAEGDNMMTGAYKRCGNANVNDSCNGWDRYEGNEWYADTHMICGRFKNWSNDRDRVYSIQVSEK